MKEHFQLKVANILERKHFENALVVAGKEGVQRIVKWVHVVEVTNIRNLLNGQELILTTGVAWKNDENLFVTIVKQLLEYHAAGLCIEMGTYMSEIPAKVIELANQHQFPIIVFQHVVPFVEITQDVHSYIITKQYEKERAKEFEWLHGWLEGEHSDESISQYLLEQGIKAMTSDAVVLITKLFSIKEKLGQDVTYFKLLFRSIFEQNGFAVFSVEKRNEVIFILLNNRMKKNLKERIKKSIETIKESEFMRKQTLVKVFIGAGKFIDTFSDIHKSYHTAKETLRIQQKMTKKEFYYFYEDLHLYRLISKMSKHLDLQELAMEYLQPVIQYDQKYNGKLLETLKVYLECNGSKQETSNKLFIVRQTLYHRLQKLENLLGDDFMKLEKRVAIEFMLLVNDYLVPNRQNNNLADSR